MKRDTLVICSSIGKVDVEHKAGLHLDENPNSKLDSLPWVETPDDDKLEPIWAIRIKLNNEKS